MSELLGPYAVERGRQPLFPEGYEPTAGYSEATAQRIDHEAQATVERMYQRARQILEEHRHTLETVAQYLLAHEVIDQETLAALTGGLRTSKHPVLSAFS